MRKKLLIGSPIRQKSNILREFLIGLDELDLSDIEVGYFFIDDNTDPLSTNLLQNFADTHASAILKRSDEYGIKQDQQYVCNSSTHQWKKGLIERITTYKNDIIDHARDHGFDYLFFVDSDIVMQPQTIKHLISRDVDIVSNVFWTRWGAGGNLMPQVWLQDMNSYYYNDWDHTYTDEEIEQKTADFCAKMRIPGLYRVGGLGACTLINRRSLESGVNFSMVNNVSFWGEDRHFCVRAEVLGLGLYVDTVYPAYHIYREAYLNGVDSFKKNGFQYSDIPCVTEGGSSLVNTLSERLRESLSACKRIVKKIKKRIYRKNRIVNAQHRITLSMIVKNEEDRYLREVLSNAIRYVDDVVIIDDASTDHTVDICREILKDIPHKIIVNKTSLFAKEYKLRQMQWRETLKMNPDWILFLDADEIFESRMKDWAKILIANESVDMYCFPLYDMWNDTHYRSDQWWNAHTRYMPFLLRYQPKFRYTFKSTNQHCGRMPKNVYQMDYANVDIRIKHYGWSREEDRIKKYERYMKLDPNGTIGVSEQYRSILDKQPNLVRFTDENEESHD